MQSLDQIKKLQEEISKLTDKQIREEILTLKSKIKESKPLLLWVIRQMKKLVLVRAMVDYLKDLFTHIDSLNWNILYMYYLAVEQYNRSKSPNYLLLVGKMLRVSKSIIATYEKERVSLKISDIHDLCVMWLWSLVKWWHDTAHAMAEHQDIINMTIGKSNPTEKDKEYLFTINQLLQNDVQELQNDWIWGELKVEVDGSTVSN